MKVWRGAGAEAEKRSLIERNPNYEPAASVVWGGAARTPPIQHSGAPPNVFPGGVIYRCPGTQGL